MSDPVSLVGGLGQLPVVASVPGFPPPSSGATATSGEQFGVTPGQAGSVQKTATDAAHAHRNATQKGPVEKSEVQVVSLEDSIKVMRDYLKNLPSDLQFQPDKQSGYVIFKVVNPVTQEVIRQYPAEEVVAMARKLNAAMAAEKNQKSGILLDGQT